MTKTSINLQELRRRIYIKAKAEKDWKFWGLYIHVTKIETLAEAYKLAKSNKGAPGIDGISFEDIENEGTEQFLKKIQEELIAETYLPTRNRIKEIPKGNGKTRTLVELPYDCTQEDALLAVKDIRTLDKYLLDAKIKKVIYVTNRILNFINRMLMKFLVHASLTHIKVITNQIFKSSTNNRIHLARITLKVFMSL